MSLMSSTALSKQPTKPARDSNIELLRILTMLGVVILHYNNPTMGGGLANVISRSANHWILLSLEGFFVCAVNLFLLITGYFSCTSTRANPAKAITLVLQVMVFRGIEYGLSLLEDNTFNINGLIGGLLPINYFVMQYVTVYLLSPYINLLLKKLSATGLRQLLIVALLLLSVWPTMVDLLQEYTVRSYPGLSTIALDGSGHGYNLINFILLYIIGGILRLTEVSVKKRYCVLVIAACTAVIAIGYTIIPGTIGSYCNPLVILEAIAIFLLFRQIPLRSRIINFLAKGAFTTFLLHMVFLRQFDVAGAVQKSPLYLIGHILFTSVTIYLLCFVVSLVYDFVFKPVNRLISYLTNKLKLEISIEDRQNP